MFDMDRNPTNTTDVNVLKLSRSGDEYGFRPNIDEKRAMKDSDRDMAFIQEHLACPADQESGLHFKRCPLCRRSFCVCRRRDHRYLCGVPAEFFNLGSRCHGDVGRWVGATSDPINVTSARPRTNSQAKLRSVSPSWLFPIKGG